MADPARGQRGRADSKRRGTQLGLLGLLGLLGGGGLWWALRSPDAPSGGSSTPAKPTTRPTTNKPPAGPVKPKPKPKPTKPTTRPTTNKPPTGPTRPTGEPTLGELLLDQPRGGGFFQTTRNHRFLGKTAMSIAYRYLIAEGIEAAKEHGGLSDADAQSWAAGMVTGSLLFRVTDLIQCSGWNDAMYGSSPRTGTRRSPNGRSILLLPRHAPVLEQLANREQPVRNVTFPGGVGINTEWREYELLWLPAVDRRALWESKTITTLGVWWPDGSTRENPPAWVLELGIDDQGRGLAGTFGCSDGDGELEVS